MPTMLNEASAAAQVRKASTKQSRPIPRAALVHLRLRARSRSRPRTKMIRAITPEKIRELKLTERLAIASVGRLRLNVETASGGTPRQKTPKTTAARTSRITPMTRARRWSALVRTTSGTVAVSTTGMAVMLPTQKSLWWWSCPRL